MAAPVTTPLCSDHPDRPSAGTCGRCGRFACAECYGAVSGRCITCERKADPLGIRLRPFTVWSAIGAAWKLLWSVPGTVAALVLLYALADAGTYALVPPARYAAGGDPWPWYLTRIGPFVLRELSVGVLVQGMLLARMHGVAEGQPVGWLGAARRAVVRWPDLAWAYAAANALVFVGLLACLVPGVLAMIAFFVVMPAAWLREGDAPLNWSTELTRGHREEVFALVLLMWLPLMLLGYARQDLVTKYYFRVAGVDYYPLGATFAFSLASELVAVSGLALALAVYYGLIRDRDTRRPISPR